jgi:glycosyltransferase involved in cell wall biosynthesis
MLDAAMSGPTRVLFVGWGLPAGGGAERQWSLLIPALRSGGFDVSLLTLVAEGAQFEQLAELGIPARCARMRHRTDLVRLRRAVRYADTRPDLVVSQSINAHVVGQLIARRVGAPHVATEHAGPGLSRARHRSLLTRFVAGRVDAVVAVSETQVPWLLDIGYPPERLTIIYNSVPAMIQTTTRQAVRDELGVRTDDFLAVVVARLRPEKRIDLFIQAVQAAARKDSRITGIVAGDGPELARLAPLADDGAVRLIGHRSDVANILGAADVVCLSSDAEASPMTLLEAMSAGKPVVATNVGGVSEAVVQEETGILVPAGDIDAFTTAMLRLASDRQLAARLGEDGLVRHRELFSMDRMVRDYAELFKRVLEERPATSASV